MGRPKRPDEAGGSLSRWLAKSEPEPKVLTPWPIPRSPDWQSRVNAALSEAELTAIQRCVNRGSPFGDEKWTETTSRRLGLDPTLRPRGRPKKES
jgi:putative transposase